MAEEKKVVEEKVAEEKKVIIKFKIKDEQNSFIGSEHDAINHLRFANDIELFDKQGKVISAKEVAQNKKVINVEQTIKKNKNIK